MNILYLATNIAAKYTVWKCVLLALSTEDEKTLQLPYSNCSAAGGIGFRAEQSLPPSHSRR